MNITDSKPINRYNCNCSTSMTKIKDVWFKKNSLAREWLVKNIEFENSFSSTFRTAGGTFEYYKYEYVMKRCIIKYCGQQAIGSINSKGGVKINLCDVHLDHLLLLQTPNQLKITFWPFVKYGLIQLPTILLQNPLFLQIKDFFQYVISISV